MRLIWQYICSVTFIVLMYIWMLVLGLLGAIPAAFSAKWAGKILQMYCKHILWLVRVLCGITYEVRGEVPLGDVVIASKHQSFLDVIMHTYLSPRVNFVMKQELKWAPILGFYAMRIGAAPVKRGDKSKAVNQMMKGVEAQFKEPKQLVIYPQGTRVAPGDFKPYKVGAAVISERQGKPCIPVATNAGVLWPKHGLLRKRGNVVFEYLEPMPKDLSVEDFTKELEARIEPASNALMAEAGFVKKD
ncbi:1-acyl-sn-glycerol-3-phosphate acyltransferase [Amylibacter sp. SFDW26]|uniref:lysophospholipid acyltransferase family protein n=1 Tax=Amylibacter sp. SFDW26 TaxID=2652722 RepID=UPI0012624BA0|nr:lysophospholipid acyltransferase family protein [Amylibacter sp. SFDW26]KAB7614786.1 1-acyl-sn-glycerol-3-phosphate acyltransferase [Amylibacter sp. SFDW26]